MKIHFLLNFEKTNVIIVEQIQVFDYFDVFDGFNLKLDQWHLTMWHRTNKTITKAKGIKNYFY